jgi:hypothetical protein
VAAAGDRRGMGERGWINGGGRKWGARLSEHDDEISICQSC